MQVNLNLTLSLILNGKMTASETEAALTSLESATDRLIARYGKTVAVAPSGVSGELIGANRAYLAKQGRQRTPKVSERETALRAKCDGVEWANVQARHEALLALGYDIFSRANAGAGDDERGETFDGEVSLTDVPTED